jgi:hypothetical protein
MNLSSYSNMRICFAVGTHQTSESTRRHFPESSVHVAQAVQHVTESACIKGAMAASYLRRKGSEYIWHAFSLPIHVAKIREALPYQRPGSWVNNYSSISMSKRALDVLLTVRGT